MQKYDEKLGTIVYGSSDDLIEFDGEFCGEVGSYGSDDDVRGALICMSDGTILEVQYGKNEMALWGVNVLRKGALLDRVEPCFDEGADPYSDVAYFRPGIKWAYASDSEWQAVK